MKTQGHMDEKEVEEKEDKKEEGRKRREKWLAM